MVNKTNANTIAKVLGSDDTDDWTGKRITIGPREVEFQGNMVWSIRVSLKKPASQRASEAERQPPQHEPEPQHDELDVDPDIPF